MKRFALNQVRFFDGGEDGAAETATTDAPATDAPAAETAEATAPAAE